VKDRATHKPTLFRVDQGDTHFKGRHFDPYPYYPSQEFMMQDDTVDGSEMSIEPRIVIRNAIGGGGEGFTKSPKKKEEAIGGNEELLAITSARK